MRRKNERTLRNCCISFGIILACIFVPKMSYGTRVFKRYVRNPIPKSVKNIKVHRPRELSGRRYVMRFKISQADLMLILNSRRFKEMMDVNYRRGILFLGRGSFAW